MPRRKGKPSVFCPPLLRFPAGSCSTSHRPSRPTGAYVRMTLGVNFNELIGFTTYQVPAAVSGGGAGLNGPIGGILGGGGLGGAGGVGGRGVSVPTGPIAPVTDPGFGYGQTSGDPFEQALKAPAGPVALAPPVPAPAGKNPPRSALQH